ncbi:MAG: nucleotidyltransferase family protein [Clostridia bacterium]|nr:nucleotidyltransferase family protein [Clostridia bacterium]
MKICAIICEYNPLHNGHLYHIREAKRLSGADCILCLMSGNFVQRGEGAILDKFTRARHAVLAGADIVIELPAVYATSNAELFATGAVQLLSSIPSVEYLCFGAENADANAFLHAAALLNNEPEEVSAQIKNLTGEGWSFAKARAEAWQNLLPTDLIHSPNNILGIEYTRAILKLNTNISILPIPRLGNGYNSNSLNATFASASAIRKAVDDGVSVENYIPEYVLKNLPAANMNTLECLEKYALLTNTTEQIVKICDCTEGLENALKKAATQEGTLAEQLTSARYTSSRIRRIALQNLLKIEESFIRDCLKSKLYLRVLAVKKDRKDILSELSNAEFPLLLRAKDEDSLTETAKKCLQTDYFTEKIYAIAYNFYKKEKNIFCDV